MISLFTIKMAKENKMNESTELEYFDNMYEESSEEDKIDIEINKAKKKLDILFSTVNPLSFWKKNEIYLKKNTINNLKFSSVSFEFPESNFIHVNLIDYIEPAKDNYIQTVLKLFKDNLKKTNRKYYEDEDTIENNINLNDYLNKKYS